MRLTVLVVLIIAIVVAGLAVVETKQQRRQLLSQKELLQSQLDEMQIVWGQLQIELATFAEYSRIENLAREELTMRLPKVQEIRVLKP